jgi:hypothetical protein
MASEYNELKFNSGDKGSLNKAIKDPKLRFKESSKIKEIWEKVFYLIQISLADISAQVTNNVTFQKEITWILSVASKLIKGTPLKLALKHIE